MLGLAPSAIASIAPATGLSPIPSVWPLRLGPGPCEIHDCGRARRVAANSNRKTRKTLPLRWPPESTGDEKRTSNWKYVPVNKCFLRTADGRTQNGDSFLATSSVRRDTTLQDH